MKKNQTKQEKENLKRTAELEKQLKELETTRKAVLNILEDTARARDALEESEARYRDLYDHAPVMYHTIDLEGNILECNEEVLNKLGYKREEYIGHNITEFVTYKYRRIITQVLQEILKIGKVEGLNREFVRKDDTVLPVELSASIIKDDYGRPTAIRAAFVDISDRLEKERVEKQLLMESQLRSETFRLTTIREFDEMAVEQILPGLASAYREILSADAISIFHYSSLKKSYINCALSVDDEVMAQMKKMIPSFKKTMTFPISKNKRMMEIMKGDKAVVSEGFNLFGSTKKITAHDRLFPGSKVLLIPIKPFGYQWGLIGIVIQPDSLVFNISRSIKEIIEAGIVRITEMNARIRDQKAKEESEKRYRSVVDNASDMIFKTDFNGHINFVNLVALKVTGYSEDELIGMNYMNLIYGEDKEQVRQVFQEQYESREKESKFECRIVSKKGKPIWVGVITTLLMEGDMVSGWQSIARDITDQKEAEERAALYTKRILALNEASRSLASSLDFQEVVDHCVNLAMELIDVDGATLFLFNSDETELSPIISVGPYVKQVMKLTLKPGEGITGQVAVSGKSKIVNRADLSDQAKQVPDTPMKPESLMCVPLKTQDRVIGVMTLRRMGKRIFYEEDLTFLENLANISSASIENARLYESLQRSEQDYRSLVETAVDPVIAIDRDKQVILWNPAAVKTFGYSEEEMVGNTLKPIFHSEEVWERFNKGFDNFLKTGKGDWIGATREWQTRHKDGHLIDIIASISARHSERGWVFTGLFKDITEEKRARQEIERLANFPKENPSPVVEINSRGNLTYINPAGKELLKKMGLDRRKVNRILPPNYKTLVRDALLKEISIPSQEVQLGGSFFLWSGNAIENLNLVHFYATDITDLKMTEKELMRAKEQAETSDRLKSVFLSTMSHEVRTPLNVILGYTDLLSMELDHKLSPEQQKFFEIIKENSDRLQRLIEDILDVSQIEAEKALLQLQSIEGEELVRNSVLEIMVAAKEKKIEVIENYNARGKYIQVDKIRFQQALGNILQNALKFTHKGGITISTTVQDNTFKISVSDTGIGIREDFKPYLFAIFRQADEGYSRSYEGAGLGLYISQRLINSMNGRIEVESEEGKGSTFTIYIPVAEEEPPFVSKESVVPSEHIPIAVEKEKLKKQTILILEDNPANLRYTEYLAKKLQLDYISAETGEKALELLKKNPVDCMLVDISLSMGMSGIEFMKRVKSLQEFKNVPCVAVTAHAMKEQEEEFLREGFDDYLAKPFTLSDLKVILEKNLRD